jgi:ankyrin repeat protein
MFAKSVQLARGALIGLALVLLVAAPAAANGDLRLVNAAAEQNWVALGELLRGGADVNQRRADGTTALIWAAHWDQREAVESLLKAGADVNIAEDHGVTALARACENASAPMVQVLLKGGANPNLAQKSGLTPLMIASETGSAAVVEALIAKGADANARTPSTGTTPLMWAVSGRHHEIARRLIAAGADVHVSSDKGFTPLLWAARGGDIEAAKILLAAGARVNDPGSEGTQALPLAIVYGRDQFALFLLEQGADPNGTLNGVSALHAAAGTVNPWLGNWFRTHGGGMRGGPRGVSADRRLPLVKALLARGANPNARIGTSAVVLAYLATPRRGAFAQNAVGTGDVGGATPLWVAGFSLNGGGSFGDNYKAQIDSSPEIVQALLAGGADHRITSNDGTTPLMAAAGLGPRSYQPGKPRGERLAGAEAAVRILVEAGADVNAINEADFTALHAATYRGWNEVVEYLVEHGANINARDYRGRTAFRLAEGAKQSFEFQSWPETAELLRKLGADTRLSIPGLVFERADRDLVSGDQQQ